MWGSPRKIWCSQHAEDKYLSSSITTIHSNFMYIYNLLFLVGLLLHNWWHALFTRCQYLLSELSSDTYQLLLVFFTVIGSIAIEAWMWKIIVFDQKATVEFYTCKLQIKLLTLVNNTVFHYNQYFLEETGFFIA